MAYSRERLVKVVPSANYSFYIISLGCSKNLVDSERINASMQGAGFRTADSAESADIVIINTCGFIQSAKEESIEVILEEAGGPKGRKIAVTGCLAERYAGEIQREIPEIDFLYGIPDEHFVTELAKKLGIDIRKTETVVPRKALYDALPYSYIKISEGCSNNCNYCSIPLIRGPHAPFPPERILQEARQAVEDGARELLIIAQDIAAYDWKGLRLPGLVERISRIDGAQWIRLLYCHPDHITDDIIDLIASNDRVVKYIDIPFQHVSGRILKSMGRKGSYESYLGLVGRLRERVPGIAIRSTFMLGYPGETEEEFRMILEFLEKARMERVGGFIYSREENTGAFSLKGQVPERTKKRRYREFMELQGVISRERLAEMTGRIVRVIVEDRIDDTSWLGRSEYDAPEIDGIFFLTAGEDVSKRIVEARITGSVDYDLMGELV